MTSDRIAQAVAARLSRTSRTERTTRLGTVVKTGIGVLDEPPNAQVRTGDLVEFVGVSFTGKTQLLHQVAASRLARSKTAEKPLVCWYDLNGSLYVDRLLQLVRKMKSDAHGDHVDGNQQDILNGLLMYNPESTLSLSTSLHALLSFMETKEGSNVDTIIIDALGMFHYEDRFMKGQPAGPANGPLRGNDEVLLINVLKQLLALRSVTVFISKAPIYEEEAIPCKWPFPEAGVPCIPKDFMPSSWNSIVSHTILVYHTEHDVQQNEKPDALRGIIALRRDKHPSAGRMQVVAASTIEITSEDILSDKNEVHLAE